MPTSISSTPLTLNDFQKFSEQSAVSENVIVGKKFFGSGLKAVSSLNFQRSFGGTSEIVTDFKKALSAKYGADIAGFVFSPETERVALSQGLSKKAIATVLKKAELANNSDFFSYRAAIDSRQKILESRIKELPDHSQTGARMAYVKIKDSWENCINFFNTSCSSDSESAAETLKAYLQQRLEVVDQVTRNILTEHQPLSLSESTAETAKETAVAIFQKYLNQTEPEAQASVKSLEQALGKKLSTELMDNMSRQRPLLHALNERATEMLAVEREARTSLDIGPGNSITTRTSDNNQGSNFGGTWQNIDDSPNLQELQEKHPQLKQFLENLTAIPENLKERTTHLNEQLKPFVSFLSTVASESYFYIDQDSSVSIHSLHVESASAPNIEQQQNAAERFFSALKEFYGTEFIDSLVSEDQQKQPLSIKKTHEVLEKIFQTIEEVSEFFKENPIFITPEYLIALSHDQEAAAAAQESHRQLSTEGNTFVQTIREIGICGIILSGTRLGLAIAGVSTTAPASIAIALGAAAIEGYLVGRWVIREEGLSADIQNEAGIISSVSTTGAALGLIGSHALQPFIGAYVPDIIASNIAEYGVSMGATLLHNATRHGLRSAENELPSQMVSSENSQLNPEEAVFFEPRLIRFFGLQPYLDNLIGALGNIFIANPSLANSSPHRIRTQPI